MVVQHNLTAINANRYLGINNKKLSKSLEKLSSGYQINRAGDDAAGLAVSEKMRSQIAGMKQGVKNAQDGISMVQTFEGALTETHSILNRMKTLADQMANGSYDTEVDRAAAQNEFAQLNDELNQIADTDFNGVVVLNGGKMADGKSASSTLSPANIGSAQGSPSTQDILYSNTATGSNVVFASDTPNDTDNATFIRFQGTSLTLTSGSQTTAVAGTDADGNTTATKTKQAVAKDSSTKTGLTGKIEVATTCTVEDYVADINGVAVAGKFTYNGQTFYTDEGAGQTVTKVYDSKGREVTSAFNKYDDATAGVSYTPAAGLATAGSVIITSNYDLSKYSVNADMKVSESNAFTNGKRNLTYTDSITLQVGARSKDAVKFTFAYESKGIGNLHADLDCSARGLGTDQLDIKTQQNANFAIDQIDNAINKVSMVRSTFGAIQNRLEHKIDNMNVSIENLTSAESQIRDTNMPEEMMEFTKNQILAQAAQSMLAQANQIPQGVLSLLQ